MKNRFYTKEIGYLPGRFNKRKNTIRKNNKDTIAFTFQTVKQAPLNPAV